MAFNFNFSGNPMLQALAAYQGSYSANKAAADRQSQVMQSQYQAQQGSAFGNAFAGGIEKNLDLSVYNPIRQQQQLQFARNYSQQVTIPQMQQHFAGMQEAQQNEHLSNAFGPGVTTKNLPDIGRQQYLQGLYGAAASNANDPVGAIGQYAQQFGIAPEQASSPNTLNDNALMARVGFHGLHSQLAEEGINRQFAARAQLHQQEQEDNRVDQLEGQIRTGDMLPASFGMQQQLDGFKKAKQDIKNNQEYSPQDKQRALADIAAQEHAAIAQADPGDFKKRPPMTVKEMKDAGLWDYDPNTGAVTTINPKTGEMKVHAGSPQAMNYDEMVAAGLIRENADGTRTTISRKTGDAKVQGHPTTNKVEADPRLMPDSQMPRANTVSDFRAGGFSWPPLHPLYFDANDASHFLMNEGREASGKHIIKEYGGKGDSDLKWLMQLAAKSTETQSALTGEKHHGTPTEVGAATEELIKTHDNLKRSRKGQPAPQSGGGETVTLPGGRVIQKRRTTPDGTTYEWDGAKYMPVK